MFRSKKPKRIKVWAVFDPHVDERRTDAELKAEAMKKAQLVDGRALRLIEIRRGEVVVDVEALVMAFERLDRDPNSYAVSNLRAALKKVGVR